MKTFGLAVALVMVGLYAGALAGCWVWLGRRKPPRYPRHGPPVSAEGAAIPELVSSY